MSESKVCEGCERVYRRLRKETDRNWSQRRHCSRDCRFRGPAVVARVMAEETRFQSGSGYVRVFCPWHPSSTDGYVYEHRLIAERTCGRLLASSEIVHHKNGVATDNRPENLQVISHREHRIIHAGTPSDTEVAELLREGKTSRQIIALGVGSHRIVRVRRERERLLAEIAVAE